MTSVPALPELWFAAWLAIAGGFGAFFASAGGLLGWRVAGGCRGRALVAPSACEACRAPLRPLAYLPCVGWLAGCRSCRARGHPCWPVIEMAGAWVAVAAAFAAAPVVLACALAIPLAAFVVGAEIRACRVPRVGSVGLLWIGLLASPVAVLEDRVFAAAFFLAAAAGWAALAARVGPAWLPARDAEDLFGAGDVWLTGALGAWLGLGAAPPAIALAVLGFLSTAWLRAARHGWQPAPFGPWLLAGIAVFLALALAGWRVPWDGLQVMLVAGWLR